MTDADSSPVIETRFAVAAVGITTILGVGFAPAAAVLGSSTVSEPVLLGLIAGLPTVIVGFLAMGHLAYHYG
ncbi:hypothetical protein SAMN06269185_0381 [Natronoarchaeum philippinense]|uniref:Uncharacterized protein n=1 Tax=Natronoarchaeum philippinense TaxID=558529 RepID=A0A285N330_NATPI|nr:hypothetical protein [Natronoarchaeum philippinense]SNZ03830.1 hypothetical protein SAMN06269185_0381 [Natronoarchaeum philippinense]